MRQCIPFDSLSPFLYLFFFVFQVKIYSSLSHWSSFSSLSIMDSQSLETIAVLNAENERMEIGDENETETQVQAQSEAHPVQETGTGSHSKRAKSLVWNDFVPIGVEGDGRRRSRCIHCNKKLVSESASGTSSLREWGLEKKVFSMTLDNATYNDSMQKILKHRLQMISGNGLLCDGKFFHVRCCAHILNLIVKEGLEIAGGLLENIRESVKFVKASGSRIEAFAACVQNARISGGAGLSLDVPTRWNSTYDMLARALMFRDAFTSLKECDRSYKSLPSQDEWDRGEKVCAFLKPFSKITTYFSGVSYPTANAYFLQVWKIECLLMEYASCDDAVMKEMAKKMRVKFSKYWDEYSLILAMGAVLDPRLKLQILRSAYDKVDARTAERKVEVVKKNLKLLYEDYVAKSRGSSSTFSATPTPHELLTESPLEDDLNYDLFELERCIQPGLDNKKTNLEMYLEDPRIDSRSFTDTEVLDYWKDQGQRYGDLAALACDLLSIPITTVASESAFSIGGRVISPYRNRLLPKNVQALICTRNWLRGFAEFEGDIEDYFDEDKDATTTASSSGMS